MSMVDPGTANLLMKEIQRIENGTDLKRVAVISRAGMKIASAASDQMDADAETASSAALIDLADRLSDSVAHGNLREILVKAESGFVILQFINDEFMVFGGINDILRVGFYMEYLRNEALRFAYILAGNQVTAELQKEIEAQKDREKRLREEAKAPLAANFKMDKDNQNDIDAMEGVLAFLKDWGEDDGTIQPDQDNIVGIDSDMMFGMDDLAPQPISQDQINSAQQTAAEMEDTGADDAAMDDVIAMLSGDDSAAEKIANGDMNNPPSSEVEEGVIPDDIMAALGEISDAASTQPKQKAAEDLPYGIKLYEDEVPPVPLEDYVSFEIGSLNASSGATSSGTAVAQTPTSTPTQGTPSTVSASEDDPFSEDIPIGPDGEPDFDHMASEYDDYDLNLEEDAMLQALEELGMNKKEKEQ